MLVSARYLYDVFLFESPGEYYASYLKKKLGREYRMMTNLVRNADRMILYFRSRCALLFDRSRLDRALRCQAQTLIRTKHIVSQKKVPGHDERVLYIPLPDSDNSMEKLEPAETLTICSFTPPGQGPLTSVNSST